MKTPISRSSSMDVQTDGVIAPEQLRRWTGVKLGANLIALDLACGEAESRTRFGD
jgi:hypothetical protein